MNNTPYETSEQQTLFQWANLCSGRYPELKWMFHIPNEGLRHPATGKRLIAEGMKKGVPDIFLPCARGAFHGLFIEMKRRKGGTTSDDQKAWLGALHDAGYAAHVCHGWEDAKEVIIRYLDLK